MAIEWEEAILAGIEARQQKDGAQWRLGDLALQVETSYREHTLENYAAEIGVDYNSLREYRRVAQAYENARRLANLSWSHHQVASGWSTPQWWLEQALKNKWSVNRMEAEHVSTLERLGKEEESTPIATPAVDEFVERVRQGGLEIKRQELHELLSDPEVAADREALELVAEHIVKPAYEGAGLKHNDPYNRLRVDIDKARTERTERNITRAQSIEAQEPIVQELKQYKAGLDLQGVCDHFARDAAKLLNKVGPLGEGERYWLEGSLTRAEEPCQAIRHYMALDPSELDEFLHDVLNKGLE
jgi:hypothetical protein